MTGFEITSAILLTIALVLLIVITHRNTNLGQDLQCVESEAEAYREEVVILRDTQSELILAMRGVSPNPEYEIQEYHNTFHVGRVHRNRNNPDEKTLVIIKRFRFNPHEVADYDRALSDAQELIDYLQGKVSWRINCKKDIWSIREDTRLPEGSEM